MGKLIEKMKRRWGVKTVAHLLLILFLFAITGITTLFARDFLFYLLGITGGTSDWVQVIAWIVIVIPTYQVLFLLYGFLLGQLEFVLQFEKKSLQRIKSLFMKTGT